ncbi:MAG: radical SAM protein [Candidatus Margulisiibacteriota bacterium]
MPTRISTLSVMVGSPACNLRCPFCISKQTYKVGQSIPTGVHLDRIAYLADKFLRVSEGLPYAILTGKGEPTLAPEEHIADIIRTLTDLNGTGKGLIVELQTNGSKLDRNKLECWKASGLNTLALSCVSHIDEVNSQIMSERNVRWNLGDIASTARGIGFLVRLTATMTQGGIENPDSLLAFLVFAKETGAQQITLREMGKPRDHTLQGSNDVADWIDAHFVDPKMAIETICAAGAAEKDSLPWARRFSYLGMSVVITDTMSPPKDGMVRSGIIQPDGHLYGSWDDPADILT